MEKCSMFVCHELLSSCSLFRKRWDTGRSFLPLCFFPLTSYSTDVIRILVYCTHILNPLCWILNNSKAFLITFERSDVLVQIICSFQQSFMVFQKCAFITANFSVYPNPQHLIFYNIRFFLGLSDPPPNCFCRFEYKYLQQFTFRSSKSATSKDAKLAGIILLSFLFVCLCLQVLRHVSQILL